MFDRLHTQWRQLKASRPGHRFRDRYERNRHSHDKLKLVWRVVRVALAAVLTAIGVLLVFIPGPAILFFALAGALLATDSLPLAKVLDWTEVRARQLGAKIRRHWRRLPTSGRIVVTAVALCLSATGTLLLYRFVAN